MVSAAPPGAPAREALHPPGVLPAVRALLFACPSCRGALSVEADAYRCAACERLYPTQGGIPDFRLFEDPYLDLEADRVRTDKVLAVIDRMPLPELLAYYWSFSDVTPEPLRARFIESALRGDGRARRLLSVMESEPGVRAARTVLEIGSGTGNFLAAAARRYERVIGTDIAMRWLHVSRRRFMDEGLPVPALVCCCAEHLPFADGSFDAVASISTLQFVKDADAVLSQCARVLGPGGAAFINTVNRFTVGPEPHVGLWGVGFLPRPWQIRYVRLRRGAAYENVRPLSRGAIERAARSRFRRRRFDLADIDDASLPSLSPSQRAQVRLYRLLKRLPLCARILGWLGPEWDVTLAEPVALP